MIIDTNKLVKVKTYADSKGVSVTWIHKLVALGEVKLIKIDSVNFIMT